MDIDHDSLDNDCGCGASDPQTTNMIGVEAFSLNGECNGEWPPKHACQYPLPIAFFEFNCEPLLASSKDLPNRAGYPRLLSRIYSPSQACAPTFSDFDDLARKADTDVVSSLGRYYRHRHAPRASFRLGPRSRIQSDSSAPVQLHTLTL